MARPLRIVMVAACPFPAPRGTPTRVRRLAEALDARGHAVRVVAYHLGAAEPLPYPVDRIPAVPWYGRTSAGPTLTKLLLLDPLLVLRLRRTLAEAPADLVHAHHYEGLAVALLARPRVPIVYDAHTLLAAELPSYGPPGSGELLRTLGLLLDRLLPGLAARTVAAGERVREALVARGAVAPDSVAVVGNGVEDRFLAAPPGPPARAPGVGTIVFTGNMAPHQGIDLLLRAFASVRERRPGARLLLVSHEPFDAHEAVARALGVRPWTEVRLAAPAEVPALLAGGDVAVSPRTDCPGVPQKLLNYMAAGRPIVAFDGSAGELEHDRTGLRVPNGDVAAFADAIVRLLDEPAFAAGLGERARAVAAGERSWAAAAARLEAVYDGVLAGAAAAAGASTSPSIGGAAPGAGSSPSQRSTVDGSAHTS